MSNANTQKSLAVYIDGFNLYHAINDLNIQKLKWFNVYAMARRMLRANESVVKVQFFTAIPDWNIRKKAKHETYITALTASGVTVTQGTFKRSQRHCATQSRFCQFREEKQTDVAIGVALVADALTDVFDRAILVTADTDQIPAVKTVMALRPNKPITWLAPPGRMQATRELGTLLPDRSELTAGLIGTCRLPAQGKDANGKILYQVPPDYI